MTKRIFSFILAALMMFTILPFMSFYVASEEIEDNHDALTALTELYSLDIYEELKSQGNAEYNAFIDIAKKNELDLFDFIVLPRKIRVALAIDLKDKTDLTQQELDYAIWAGPSVLPDEMYNSYYVQDNLVVFFDSALYIEGINKDTIGTEFAHSDFVINTDADGRRYANGMLTFNSPFKTDDSGNLISGYTMESIMKANETFGIDLGLEEFNIKVDNNGKSVVYDHKYHTWNFFNQPNYKMPYSNMLNATSWGTYAVKGVEKGNIFALTAIADVNSGTLNYDKEKGAYPFPENTLGTIYDYMCNSLKKPTENEIASGAKTFEGAYVAQITEEYAEQGHTVTNSGYLGSYAGTKGEYKTVYKSLTGQDIDVETFNFPEPEIVADKYPFDGTFVLKLLANGDSIIPDKYDTSVIIPERAFAYENKSSYNFSIGNGVNADIYLTRVYSKALSESEVEQNHFVDLMKYNKVGIYAYEKLSDDKKAIVHSAFADIKLEDKSREELRALFLAEVEDLVCEDHTFDREVASEKFLKSPATTTVEATYYKSCLCGEKCEETFTIPGLLDSDGVGKEGDFTYKVADGCAIITNCDINASGTIVVPNTLGGYPVTEISTSAFSLCKNIEVVKFGDNSHVTRIGELAFFECSSLKYIEIPADVNKIGSYAFVGCSLVGIAVDDENAYYHSEGNCIIKTSTGELVVGCKNSEIPDGVTSIAELTFARSGIQNVQIPASVIYIESGVFSDCGSIESITVDAANPVYYSDENCLINKETKELILGCNSSVIPEGVESIGFAAFYGCEELTAVTIPQSVKSIGDYAFYNCGLTEISFDENSALTSIGDSAFYNCSGLTTIDIPANVKAIGDNAFSGCVGLTGISFDEHSQLASIGNSAFLGCEKLESIDIPYNVTDIGSFAFSGCIGLESITVAQGNTVYQSRDNSLINKEKKELILGLDNATIPVGVESISNGAFEGRRNLQSIVIPASVVSIGDFAFSKCVSLTSVIFAGDSALTSIGDYAFAGCYNLKNLVMPEDIESIGNYAFSKNFDLESVTIPEGIESIGESAFLNNVRLADVYYAGAEGQWNAVEKGANWDKSVAYNMNSNASHTHVFDKEIASESFLVQGTGCTTQPIYYKSCECGAIGSGTFSGGEALGHTGGVASCQAKAICERCGEQYGEIGTHVYNKEVAAEQHKKETATCHEKAVYYKSCECGETYEGIIDATFEYGEALGHIGGKATCQEKAVCERCGTSYGTFGEHVYDKEVASDVYLKSEANCTEKALYYKSCDCGESSEGKVEEDTFEHGEELGHTGGSASCTEQAICDRCEEPYGDLLAHVYDKEVASDVYLKSEANCTEKAVYYKSCDCGESSEGKAGEATFEYGEALGHTGGKATYTEQAICDRCDEPYGELLESAIDLEYANQLLTFIGYQSRISAYPGIRSLYGISKEHLEAIEAEGFEVIVGAIMAGANGRTTSDLVVPSENGIYKSDAFKNHSYKENGISIIEVYDGAQTGNKVVGKVLNNDSDSIDFAYTTVFKTEATQSAMYYQAGLLYRGYIIVKGANSDGTDLILYTNNESVLNGGSNGEAISLEEASRYMKDQYGSDDEMTQMVLKEIEFSTEYKHICGLMYSTDGTSSWAGVGSYYTLEKGVTFSSSIVSRLEQASRAAYESTIDMTSKNATLGDLLAVFEEYKQKVKNIIDSADKYDVVILTDDEGYEIIKVKSAWGPTIK